MLLQVNYKIMQLSFSNGSKKVTLKGYGEKYLLLINKPLCITITAITANYYYHSEKILFIKLDSNFLFENHVGNLCKKAIQNVLVLGRIATYIDFYFASLKLLSREPLELPINITMPPSENCWEKIILW